MPVPIFRKTSTSTHSTTISQGEGDGASGPSAKPTNLFRCISQETENQFWGLFMIGSVSGISSAALLAIINIGAETANMGYVNFRIFLLFLIGMALFFYSKRHVMNQSRIIFENLTSKICKRQIDKLRHAHMQDLEKMGQSEIYSRITKELDTITHFSPIVVDAAQGAVLVSFSLVYLYVLSKMTFLLMIGATVLGSFFFLFKQKEITTYTEQSTQKEIELFTGLSHILDGFKEIKLDQAKNNALMNYITQLADQTKELKIKSGLASNFYFIFSQISLYLMLGAVVFVLPHFSPTYPEVVIKTTVAILFMMGSLEHMVGVLPHYANINVAVRNIYALEDELDRIDERHRGVNLNGSTDFRGFQKIGFDSIFFHYKDAFEQPLFSIGPLNFHIDANETVFIIGGNGSGKSTFIKVLTGLYFPESGSIQIDDRNVSYSNFAAYRNLFGGVLSEFHLFDRLYGLEEVDEVKLNEWLKIMQLDHKTSFVDGRFTSLDLSSGQRARLALITTLMEDKPVYVLDEWAAAQDPEFRQYFYEVILADLKKAGKTVLVVSHDDRYFHIPDRILKMEYGKIVESEKA
jgi:putative pyoverdin transport system ATP-binding/permease protein